MPEIIINIDRECIDLFTYEMFQELDKFLTDDIEEIFGIKGKNDVECKVPEPPRYSRGTKNVGIDINYTEDDKGEDQYNQGKRFRPTKKVQKILVRKIKEDFKVFCKKHETLKHRKITVGVWSKPHRGTYYE